MKIRKQIFGSAIVAITLVVIAGCGNVFEPDDPFVGNNYKAESSFSFTIETHEKSKIDVNSINGDIEVVGIQDASKVTVEGIKVVKSDSELDAEKYLKNLKVNISESGNTVHVYSEHPNETHGRDVSIHYYITVPSYWAAQLELANGECSVDSLNGDLMIKLTNGNVCLCDNESNVYVQVTNGQIIGKVIIPPNGLFNGQTTNGIINLSVPVNTSARLSAQVTNGVVNVSGLTLENMIVSQKIIKGVIGQGNGSIELQTTNGNINVMGY